MVTQQVDLKGKVVRKACKLLDAHRGRIAARRSGDAEKIERAQSLRELTERELLEATEKYVKGGKP